MPGTTTFLVEEGELLGVVNLRHRLTNALLEYGGHVGYSVRPSARGRGCATRLLQGAVRQAQAMGIDRVLVTCAPSNTASLRVIDKCGGVFEDERRAWDDGEKVRRYWIDPEAQNAAVAERERKRE